MVFDQHRRRIVYFGGQLVNTTEFWDGSVWNQLDSATNAAIPAPRWSHAMAYDSDRHTVVVFGGQSTAAAVPKLLPAETWELVAVDTPLINQQPASQFRQAGDTATFDVIAVGPQGETLQYQWFSGNKALADDARILGSRTADLRVTQVSSSDAGLYSVSVSSDCGVTKSRAAILTLSPDVQVFSVANTTTLVWSSANAVLQQANSVNGPWSIVEGASSPFDLSAFGPAKFFRLSSSK